MCNKTTLKISQQINKMNSQAKVSKFLSKSPTSSSHSYVLVTTILITLFATTEAFEVSGNPELSLTKYTQFSKNVSYVSSTEYNAMGMQPLYNITQKIMMFFVGEEPLPDGYIELKNNDIHYGPKVLNNEWGELIKQYWIILVILVVAAILAILMPVIGLCFCCCRCAGACGGRSEPFDKKHDTCRRVCLGLLLIVLATGVLFGVIVTFATNTYVNTGLTGATGAARSASFDSQTYIRTTGEHLEFILVNNYNELSIQLKKILHDTSGYIISNLEKRSSAVSMKYLTDVLDKLPEIKDKMQQMKIITNELRVHASQLSDGLRGVKRGLLDMLTKCQIPACKDVLNDYEIGKLDANGIHYDQLPDLTQIVTNLDVLISGNIASAGQRGREALQNMRINLKNQIESNSPQIENALKSAGVDLQKASTQINSELQRISNIMGRYTERYTGVVDNFMDEYNPYRFYFGLAVCCVLLLILILLVAALCCGICGKRPGGYGDDCCNKGAGSRFLMIAVALIFLSFSIILVTAVAHFLLGTVAYRGICVPLENPNTDPMFTKIDAAIDLNDILFPQGSKTTPTAGVLPPLRISQVITSCHANNTIYEVLHLQNRIDVDEIKDYPSKHKINQTLEKLVDGINFQQDDINILSEEDKQRILSLGESALKQFNSGQFIDNLADNITKHSLIEVANQLRNTAKKVPDSQKDIQISLRNQALHLETYEQNLVIPMKEQISKLIKLAEGLDNTLRYRDRPFEDSIPLLVQEISKAQRFINEEGRPFVRSAASNLTRYFSEEIYRYLDLVVNSVKHEIGRCDPMANVYDASLVAVCNRFVNPLNGFWAGCIWCVILFLPTLFVAVRLASLYQKSDPYPGPLVESEYLYDAYSERDHIPLANGPKNKRRKNKDRRRHEYYEEAVGGTGHVMPPSSSAAAGGGSRDTRYNDMAPKHWDGGPPRYANPPMAPPASEYERPPPYYYPGATDQE